MTAEIKKNIENTNEQKERIKKRKKIAIKGKK